VVLTAGALLAFAALPAAAGPQPAAGSAAKKRIVPPNPFAFFERFERMTPRQRERMLSQLPEQRRRDLEERVARYRQMPPDERDRLRDQYEMFQEMPKEKQDALRRAFRRFSKLPLDRRQLLRQEYLGLRAMEDEDRRSRINSDEFRSRYTLAEQQLLDDISKLLPLPQTASAMPSH
jgi:hypothetical protein